jgi:Ca2+-binding RTX toxin-like protein
LAFWVKEYSAATTQGAFFSKLISNVVNYNGTDAAGVTSKSLFANKVAVAQYYGEQNGTVAGATAALNGVTSAAASVDAAKAVILNTAVSGQTFTLTTSTDSGTSFSGGNGNDNFNSIVGSTLGATDGTTFNPGDNISGGGGTDTLNVSVSGTDGGTGLDLTAFTLSGIERVMVANYELSEGAGDTTRFNMANVTGTTTIGLNGSSATGDTEFSTVKNLVSAEMNSGAGDLSITYIDSAVSGTADTQNLALSGVTAGTFAVAATATGGVETLAITSSGGTRNVLTGVTNNASLTSITVAGDTALTLGALGAAVTSVNASANTGGVTATLSGTQTTAITGSAGNDSFTSGTVLTTGSVNAGLGTDTLVTTLDTVLATSALGAKYTGFETLSVSTTGTTANGTRAQDVSLVSGITTLNFTTTATTANGDTTHDVTLSNLSSTSNTLNITGLANADATGTDDYSVSVTATRAANTAADAITVNLGTTTAVSGATAVGLDSGAGAVILDVSLANEESITINSLGGTTGVNLIDDLTNTSATSMTFTGARNLTVDSMTSTVVTSINASAMTGAFMNLTANSGAVASTISGGSGNDSILGGSAADNISGNAGADSINGAAGNDVITGGAGNDTINAGSGIDNIGGGDGDDTFNVTAAADFIGLTAAETISGGDGNDNLVFDDPAVNTTFTIAATDLLGISSIDRITIDGTANAGSITLTDAVYTANGLSQIRIIDGDTTQGTLTVNASALTGTNSIHVTANTVTGANGTDTLTGGAGNDTFVFSTTVGLEAADTVVGGAGTADTISLTATAAVTANLTGVRTVERVVTTGNGGDVSITVGSDDVLAASATLTVDASTITNNAFDLAYNGSAITTGTKIQNVTGTTGDDTIAGGAGNDVIVGGDGADSITGGAGIDNLSGGAGADIFVVATTGTGFTGLSSAETISGGAGTDILQVAAGVITIAATDLTGLTSIENITISNTTENASLTLTDAIFTSNGVAALTVDGRTITSGVLTLAASGLSAANSISLNMSATLNSGAHVINLGSGNDTLLADLDALDQGTIAGGAGTDTITLQLSTTNNARTLVAALTGFEVINFGTAGATIADNYSMVTRDVNVASGETLTVNGSNLTGTLTFDGSAETNGKFSLTGGTGTDSMIGGEGVDTIIGGAGADTIQGGLLADVLTGNIGADVFEYTAVAQSNASNTDSITDFASGTDKLNVTLNYSSLTSALDINATVQTARAGTALIQDNLSGARGQATYDTTGSALYINFNNDNLLTTSDYKININPAATATATIAEGDINFVITGGTVNDVIAAGGGADTISGEAGNDSITAGAGADNITAGEGTDTVVSGAGSDAIFLAETTALVDTVRLTGTGTIASGTVNIDTISSFSVGANSNAAATSEDVLQFGSTWLGVAFASGTVAACAGNTSMASAAQDGTIVWASNNAINGSAFDTATEVCAFVAADANTVDV